MVSDKQLELSSFPTQRTAAASHSLVSTSARGIAGVVHERFLEETIQQINNRGNECRYQVIPKPRLERYGVCCTSVILPAVRVWMGVYEFGAVHIVSAESYGHI